jgi:large subunit ribosomal protein L4
MITQMEIGLISQTGKKLEKITLPADIFSARVNPGLLHEVVRMYQANKRRGTASTKARGEVRGAGRKPWRQKGTGRSRVGSIRTPVWRGGGVAFGPKPRDYSYTMPRKKLKLALRQALSDKLNNGEIVVIDKIELANPKTREMAKFLKGLNVKGRIALVLEKMNEKIKRAGQNIPLFTSIPAKDLNIYDVLLCNKLIFTKDALSVIEERLHKPENRNQSTEDRKKSPGKEIGKKRHGTSKST